VEISEKLKNYGYRLTQQRRAILNVLQEYPLTVEEIYNELKKSKVSLDLVSVYRTLEVFLNKKIVYSVDFGDGKKRYELVNDFNHHHHLICNQCRKIEDIKIDEKKMTNEISRKSQFKIDHHHLEFFGLCSHCQ
jgi:Fur family ferric uptake transcriptional regulator